MAQCTTYYQSAIVSVHVTLSVPFSCYYIFHDLEFDMQATQAHSYLFLYEFIVDRYLWQLYRKHVHTTRCGFKFLLQELQCYKKYSPDSLRHYKCSRRTEKPRCTVSLQKIPLLVVLVLVGVATKSTAIQAYIQQSIYRTRIVGLRQVTVRSMN